MPYETIETAIDGRGVATLTLARPEKRNAMSSVMIDELDAAARMLGGDPDVRAIVLAARGPVFCAGGDLAWMREQIQADRAQRIREATRLAMMLRRLNETPKPVIGRVHGDAFGGGVGLMAICDVVVASDDARFGLTETRLGLIPATIAPYVIARMGEGAARRVFMSARMFDADEAERLGLVARRTPLDGLDAAVEAETAPYLATSSEAVGRAKALARALGPSLDDAVVEDTIERLADAWESADAAEGIAAFLEKRKPRWAP